MDKNPNNLSGKKNCPDLYETIFTNAIIGISILNREGVFLEVNPTFTEHMGLPEKQILNKHYCQIFDADAIREIKRMINLLMKRKQTHIKDVITQNTNHLEKRIIEISFSQMNCVFDQDYHYMLITEDITNQKETHAALLQSEKLALTGRLAASLAHEINNPLQTSLGCLGLVEEMLEDDVQNIKGYVDIAINELQRSARIVKQLRDLNQNVDLFEKTKVNLKDLIEGILVLIKNQLIDRNILPVTNFPDTTLVTYAAKDQLHQVILNIIINAIDAMPNGGQLTIDTIQTQSPGGKMINISDTGVGISPEQLQNLFDPFFTTKKDGLGLGLYISKEIITAHEGTLNIHSKSREGSKISIWLPDKEAIIHKE